MTNLALIYRFYELIEILKQGVVVWIINGDDNAVIPQPGIIIIAAGRHPVRDCREQVSMAKKTVGKEGLFFVFRVLPHASVRLLLGR